MLTENTAPAGIGEHGGACRRRCPTAAQDATPELTARVATASASWTQKSGVHGRGVALHHHRDDVARHRLLGLAADEAGQAESVAGPNDSVSQPNTAP